MNIELSTVEAARIRVALGQKIDAEKEKPQTKKRKQNVAAYRALLDRFFPQIGQV